MPVSDVRQLEYRYRGHRYRIENRMLYFKRLADDVSTDYERLYGPFSEQWEELVMVSRHYQEKGEEYLKSHDLVAQEADAIVEHIEQYIDADITNSAIANESVRILKTRSTESEPTPQSDVQNDAKSQNVQADTKNAGADAVHQTHTQNHTTSDSSSVSLPSSKRALAKQTPDHEEEIDITQTPRARGRYVLEQFIETDSDFLREYDDDIANVQALLADTKYLEQMDK